MAQVKVSDLCVGDWVQDKEGTPAKILGIEQWSGEYYLNVEVNGVDVGNVIAEGALPIPITPEILEKNGLCVVEEDADFSEYELFGSENFSIFHLKGTLHYRLETPRASLVCWNVHQLQHALRLANIEKEIEV